MGTIDWANGRVILDPEAFRATLAELKSCVGDEHVKHLPADLDIAGKATIPHPKRPAAVVYPGTSDEVAAVVKIAARHGIPLWPCSRGRNWGYGSATPVLENTVVLHLERLDRIIEVNEELAYALLEPGVTYRQLREHLDRHHPGLWCDCTDGTPGGSVIGNALDRGLGTTPYADHFGTLCGLEVVLPSGEFVRTGGGPPGCKTWNTHKWGVGPYLEGLFSQSNFGVVTKAGVWLMPKPEAFASFTFDLARDEDLPRIVDIIRELALKNIITSAVHLINDIVALSVVTQYPPSLLDSHSRLPDEVRAGMRNRYGVAGWSFGGGIQGTKASVRAAKRELHARLKPLGRLVFLDDAAMKGVEMLIRWRKSRLLAGPIDWAVRSFAGKSPEMLEAGPHIHSVLKGIPSDYFVRHAYFKSRKPKPAVSHPDRDDIGLIWFAPIAPMTGAHVEEVMGLCKPLFEEHQFDFYAALLVQNPRSMIVLMSIFFLKDDPVQVERAAVLYKALSAATAAARYQCYRVGTQSMLAMGAQSPEFLGLVQAMKASVDPDSLLAPGKYGAW
jgi:4-cresol dehydrogenase (hydroxylating) flavoprotein subunit